MLFVYEVALLLLLTGDRKCDNMATVIRQIANGKKKADLCREFGFVNSAFQTIWKNRTKIINALEQNGWRIKRFRKPERSDVNGALLKCSKQQRSENESLNGPLL